MFSRKPCQIRLLRYLNCGNMESGHSAVILLAGGTLTVKLISNATTGALWSNPVQLSNPIILGQTSHEYIPPAIPNPGAGGQEVWIFHSDEEQIIS